MGETKLISMDYLNIISYRDLFNWSAAHLLGNDLCFTKRYPFVRIGVLLKPNRNVINIKDNVEYKQVTVKTNGGGAILRGVKVGKDIGTKKQYQITTGQFIMSKIDARNGAFGIVPEGLNGAIVTGDFPVFDVDKEKLNPAYLQLLSCTKPFIRFAQSCSRGTTNRQRIDVKQFLSLQIPLPALKEQDAIVATYNNSLLLAEQYEQQALQIELGIDDFFISILGITTRLDKQKHSSEYKYLRFVDFLDLSEWGVDIIRKKKKRETFKYHMEKIKNLCKLGSGGTPSRSCSQYYKGTIPWVKTGEVINDEIFETEEHITEEAIKNSSAKLYPKGSLIIAMYGQGDTRGRTAKLGIDATTNQACAVLHDIDNSIVSTDYLWYFLQGRYHDLRSLASGNNQPNLNAGKINNYDVVVPPMDIQNEMVAHIKEQKALAKQLKKKAGEMRENALKEFEDKIFK